jgi:hypothetical protein
VCVCVCAFVCVCVCVCVRASREQPLRIVRSGSCACEFWCSLKECGVLQNFQMQPQQPRLGSQARGGF